MDAPTPPELPLSGLLDEVASPVPDSVGGPLRAHLAGLGAVLRFASLAFVAYSLFFNLSVVRGSSMTPGIQDGDRILVEPWSYLLGPVERGDVIVLRYPLDPEIDYIKRVIGLPGDRVALAHGRVWVNEVALAEPYVEDIDASSTLVVTVEPGHYFVLGDNRPRSSDSREFGLVPDELVRGRVDLCVWPPARAGWIE
jgi:signal peptidase I